jgi:hypothetical protein
LPVDPPGLGAVTIDSHQLLGRTIIPARRASRLCRRSNVKNVSARNSEAIAA